MPMPTYWFQRKVCIAICGLKRSGKDTVADLIASATGMAHVKVSAPLKRLVKDMFDLTPSQVEDDCKDDVDARWGLSPREIMQFVGTDMFQYKLQELMPSMGRRFWITKAIHDWGDQSVVVSDVRFNHELQELRRHFDQVHVIRVQRRCVQQHTDTDSHVSEQEYKTFLPCSVIDNNGSLYRLRCAVYDALNQIEQTPPQ